MHVCKALNHSRKEPYRRGRKLFPLGACRAQEITQGTVVRRMVGCLPCPNRRECNAASLVSCELQPVLCSLFRILNEGFVSYAQSWIIYSSSGSADDKLDCHDYASSICVKEVSYCVRMWV